MKNTIQTIAIALATLASPSLATDVEVSQESAPMAGDFDANILGVIQMIDTPQTPEDYYGYQTNNDSYHGPAPLETSGTSFLFVLNSEVSGQSLGILHDEPMDGSGGSTQMAILISGDPDGADFVVADDPASGDDYLVLMNGTALVCDHQWLGCCTDGAVIGALDGDWSVVVQFNAFSGIDNWSAYSADASTQPLALEPLRRVRLRAIAEPPASSLFCFGDGSESGCEECPCNNNAPSTAMGGCLNGTGASGRLRSFGSSSVSDGSLRFEMTGGTFDTFGVLFSADTRLPVAGPCQALGTGQHSLVLDGLDCISGNRFHHGTRATSSAGSIGLSTPGWGGVNDTIALGAGFTAGQTRHFQVIYRDEDHLVCQRGENSSNGVTVVFTP